MGIETHLYKSFAGGTVLYVGVLLLAFLYLDALLPVLMEKPQYWLAGFVGLVFFASLRSNGSEEDDSEEDEDD